MWTVPEMLHWTVKKELGYVLYYFVRVDRTYCVYSRKTTKFRKQGYKITQYLWPSWSHVQVCLCMKRDMVKSFHTLRSMIWVYVNLYYSVWIIMVKVTIFEIFSKGSGVKIFPYKGRGWKNRRIWCVCMCLCVCYVYLHHFYQNLFCFRGMT